MGYAQAVVGNPGVVAENLIQPIADLVSLELAPFSDAQASATFRVRNAALSTDWFSVLPSGNATAPDPASGDGLSERFGNSASAAGTRGTAIGNSATLSAPDCVSIGFAAGCAGTNSVSIGVGANGLSTHNTIIGAGASGHTDKVVAIGNAANITGDRSTGVGADSLTAGDGSTAVGGGSQANDSQATCVGQGSYATHSCVGIGYGTRGDASPSFGDRATALGAQALANGDRSTLLGASGNIAAGHNKSIGLGAFATSTGPNQLVVGNDSADITDCYFGRGVLSASPAAVTFHVTGGSGTNIAGANHIIAGGQSTGSAKGGDVLIQTSPAGGAGTSLNALATLAAFTGDSKIGVFTQAGTPVVQQANASQAGINSLAGAVYATDAAAIKAALQAFYTALANLGWCAATA
jgi:hypothetical protein